MKCLSLLAVAWLVACGPGADPCLDMSEAGAPSLDPAVPLPTCAIEFADVCGQPNAVQIVCDRNLATLAQPCANQFAARACDAAVPGLACEHETEAIAGGVRGAVWCCL